MDKPRLRSTSSAQFAAVTTAVGGVLARMIDRLNGQRRLGIIDLSDEQIETIARIARGLAHDSTVDAYNQGRRDGRLRARLELGEPADELNAPLRQSDPLCPTCKRVVD